MDLKEVDILGDQIDQHWYYRAKAAALRRLTRGLEPRTILDVGAGSGFFSRDLLRRTSASEAWCIDTSYRNEWDEELNGKPLHFRRGGDWFNADLLLMMDVLEHVENDRDLLHHTLACVPSGCRVVVTVPAFQWLWSEHDEFLKHWRRYTLAEVESLMQEAGLRQIRGLYYFGLVLPLAAALRLPSKFVTGRHKEARSGLKRHSPPVNNTLALLCRWELSLMDYNRLAGLTIFCTAFKTK